MKIIYFLSFFLLFSACMSCVSTELSRISAEAPQAVTKKQNVSNKMDELATDAQRKVIQSSNLKSIMWIECPDLNFEIRVYQLTKKNEDLWDRARNLARSGEILQEGNITVQIHKDSAIVKIAQYENHIKKYDIKDPMIISRLHTYFITEDGVFYAKTKGVCSHPWEKKPL